MIEVTVPRAAARPVAQASRIAGTDVVQPALVAFGAVAALGAADGGYFEPSWGWAATVLLGLTAVVLLVRGDVRLSTPELATLGALAAFVGLSALSASWSLTSSGSIREAFRGLVYIGALAATLVLLRRRSAFAVPWAVYAAIVAVSGYALATRLFPDRAADADPIAVYRLAEPLGYWNALALLATLGLLLGAGLAATRGRRLPAALAAAPLPALGATVLFTFGRGAWVALAAGLAAMLALSDRRLDFITALLLLAPAVTAGLVAAAGSGALTRRDAPLVQATDQGRRLAVLLVVLGGVSAAAALVRFLVRRRPGPTLRRLWATLLVLVAVVALAALLARYGGPVDSARRAYDGFVAPPVRVQSGGDYTQRLFSLSSNGRTQMWRVAWDGFEERPLSGSGAGSYEFRWAEQRPTALKVRDAHGLYQETLSELGLPGLALLATALGLPLAAAVRARRSRTVPVVAGAYVAFLVHAGLDWDWEMPALTVAGLLCAAFLLVNARGGPRPLGRWARTAGSAAALVLAAVALSGWVGSAALTASESAADRARWGRAGSEADRAVAWLPWSAEARRRQGSVRLARGDVEGASRSFRAAIDRSRADWTLWLDLALVSRGAERRRAILEARRLNPYARTPRTLVLLPGERSSAGAR